MTTFFDTNALIYMLNENDQYHSWAISQFERGKARGPIVICDIVYCELSIGMNSKEEVDAAVSHFALERLPPDDNALVRAGIAFKEYRRNNGQKANVLPDFFVGAYAEIAKLPLVTADVSNIRTYFPQVQIIHP